jgi:hypothetical protein
MIAPAARRQWSTGKPAQHYRDGRRVALAAGSSADCLPLLRQGDCGRAANIIGTNYVIGGGPIKTSQAPVLPLMSTETSLSSATSALRSEAFRTSQVTSTRSAS